MAGHGPRVRASAATGTSRTRPWTSATRAANQKNSGFLPEERAWLTQLFGEHGWVDSYRHLHPDGQDYTWWSQRGAARAKNVGWRIDYQVVSPNLRDRLKSCQISPEPQILRSRPLRGGTRMTQTDDRRRRRRDYRGAAGLRRAFGTPSALTMLFLGFGSGLPFLLVGGTLSTWLRDVGFDLAAIGLISYISFFYVLKFLWAPLVDRFPVPLLGRLGRRRGWLLGAQLLLAVGLAGMAAHGPIASLRQLPDPGRAGGVRRRHPGHRGRRLPDRDRAARSAGRARRHLHPGLPLRH